MRWFGPRWESVICKLGERLTDPPIGSTCRICQEQIKEGEPGLMDTEIIRWDGDNAICREVPVHRNCMVAFIQTELKQFLDEITGRGRPNIEPDPEACDHQWWVYSTSTAGQPKIMVQCNMCCVLGSTAHFTKEEWAAAFHAPTKPFLWTSPVETVGKRPADLAEGIPKGEQA